MINNRIWMIVLTVGLLGPSAMLGQVQADLSSEFVTQKSESITNGEQLTKTGTISLGEQDLITNGIIEGREVRATGTGTSEVNKLSVTGAFKVPYGSNELAVDNGDLALSSGITDLGPTLVYYYQKKYFALAIPDEEFIPIAGHTFYYDADKDGFVMGPAALALFGRTGENIHPDKVTNNLIIGGTDAATGDTVLLNSGRANFNEQGNDVDFRIESDTNDAVFFVDGTGGGKVGINTQTPQETLTVNGNVLVEGRGTSHIDFGNVTSDPCGDIGEGSMFYNDTANYFCFCNGTTAVQLHNPTVTCFK